MEVSSDASFRLRGGRHVRTPRLCRSNPRLRRPDRSRTGRSTSSVRPRSPATTTGSSITSRRSPSPAVKASSAASCRSRRSDQRREGRRLGPSSVSSERPTRSCSWPKMRRSRAPARAEILHAGPDRRARHHDPPGGGPEVGAWATEHGFRLPPDAPEVLDFYANRSPIFLAAVFDADAAAARGQAVGDGTPVHITIPDRQPVGSAPHPGPRQVGIGDRGSRCLPADR